jgi:hypothetical protein
VKLPTLKGGASRKGKYLFQIASLNPALKGGACREANRPKIRIGFADESILLAFDFGWIYILVAISEHDQNSGHFPPDITWVVQWGYIIRSCHVD